MAINFVYKVRDQLGRAFTGKIRADSRDAVIERLRENGYIVTSLEAKTTTPTVNEAFSRLMAVNARDLSIMCCQFSAMMNAGLPLLKTLSILEEQTSKIKLSLALADIGREVENGSSLSVAFSKHPSVFPPLMVAMIRAGETGGILDEVLDRLAEHFEKEYELKQKIKTATRYPFVVVLFAIAALAVMITFVVPAFADVLSSLNIEKPLPTKVLMATSALIKKYFVPVILAIAMVLTGIVYYLRTPQGKKDMDRMVLRIPIAKDVIRKIAIARLSRTMGALLGSGVPIIQALEVSEEISANSVIIQGLGRARDSIREGEGLAGPLEATEVFYPMVIQMITVGEETGNLDTMLKKVADFYEREAKYTLENFSTLIEPVLIGFLGIVVGGMIMSFLWPLMKIYENVKNI